MTSISERFGDVIYFPPLIGSKFYFDRYISSLGVLDMYQLSHVTNCQKLTHNVYAKLVGDVHTFTCDRLTVS